MGYRLTSESSKAHADYTRLFMQSSATHVGKGYVFGMIAACVVILYVDLSGAEKKNSSRNPRQKPVQRWGDEA